MSLKPESSSPLTTTPDPIRIMVVDDSAVIRGAIVRILDTEAEFKVVATVANGQMAVDRLRREKVDVIVLDIEMPEMDGITALPHLLAVDPGVRIVMASTLTQRNAGISIRALQAGASDYVPKPTSASGLSTGEFRREIVEKIKVLGAARKRRSQANANPNAGALAPLRKSSLTKPEILAIGSSTGGPQALSAFMTNLRKDLGVPIVITQHMPPMFTNLLAEHMSKSTGWRCKEGVAGDILTPNTAYVAPGNFHMTVIPVAGKHKIELDLGPPENFCRPSVDPMLRSAVREFGGRVLTVILTGMGSDGCKGSRTVVEAGGTVLAQDEASSVVWGMPGAVARAGLCAALLPPPQLAAKVNAILAGAP